jgi:uncharacterized damage-inducible protein DinB
LTRPCDDDGVGAEHDVARSMLEEAHSVFVDNVRDLTIEEALDAGGGFRSILGLMKHVAGWSAVYHSYAFDAVPRSWEETDWPRGLRDSIDQSDAYLHEMRTWFERTYASWQSSVAEADLGSVRPVHWGETKPLRDIVAIMAANWAYHAGEINEILAIGRGEAWEWGEEVEENHISTEGHGVQPPWMSDDEAAQRRSTS